VSLEADATWALVGRREELDLVFGWLRSADAGVVLAGAGGVGKTRLAVEACVMVGEDLSVEWCVATRAAASIPFGPLAHLVVADRATGVLTDTLRETVAAIAARPHRTLVAVDDAHLLDEASAALVHRLAVSRSAAVLVTVRDGEPVPDPVLSLWKDGLCGYVELQPLSQDETTELVTAALGGQVEGRSAERLWALTGGNALFLREVLRAGREDGALALTRGVWRWRGPIGAPRRLADLVHARLGWLDPAQRELLALVAFAEPVPLELLRSLADDAVLAGLGRRGLVAADGTDGSALVRLGHPLYGEVLRAEASTLEAVAVARRLAEAALATGFISGPHLRRVAAWALEAGVELPLEAVLAAAQEALAAADPSRAERLARLALDRRPSFAAALALARALEALQRHEEADAVSAEAIDLATRDEERAVAAMSRVQALHYGLGRVGEAEAVLRDVATVISDPAWRDVLAGHRAMTLAFAGHTEEAAAIAVPLLESPDERVRLRALSPAASLLTLGGTTDRVLTASAACVEPALRLRGELPAAPLWVASTRLLALLVAGELAEANSLLDLIDQVDAAADAESRGFVHLARGRLALFEGRVVTAATHLREAVALLDDANTAGRQSWGLCLLAEALACMGDAGGAQRAVEEADRAARPTTHLYDGDAARARAWALVAAGLMSDARDVLFTVAEANKARAPVYELFALHDAVRLGTPSETAQDLAELAERIDGRWAPVFAAHAKAARRDDASALDAVAVRFEQIGAYLLAAEAAAEAAAAHRHAGRTGSATLAAARTATLAAHCEGAMTPVLRHPQPDLGLTDREREIAVLAARGWSSPQIATRLVLSVRTVDNHLQRVYAKLGINRRNDLSSRLTLLEEPLAPQVE
jgi:DNA-binding CsgD family transcriptional regulator